MDFNGTERFEKIRLLGTGGMGTVYEVIDHHSKMRLALKVMEPISDMSLYRFKNEFRSLADIKHTNLVEFYELISDGEQWFYTMELVRGIDFLTYCGGSDREDDSTTSRILGPLPISDAELQLSSKKPRKVSIRGAGLYDSKKLRNALKQLCEGVHALHEEGVLHRDLKPSNILVTQRDRVVILDFGLAKFISKERASNTPVGIRGTPAYMAPEQADDHRIINAATQAASDWYSVGVILYQVLTGQLPFSGTTMHILVSKQTKTPPAPRLLNPDVEPDLNSLCCELLLKKPDDRPTGREILARLGVLSPSRTTLTSFPVSPITVSDIFVGRHKELRILKNCWEAAVQGDTIVTLIGGPSGVGKTALINQFIREFENSEDRFITELQPKPLILKGRFYERETVPYKAFDTIIDELSSYLSTLDKSDVMFVLPEDIQYLVAIFPVLKRVKEINDSRFDKPSIRDPNLLRRRAFVVFRTLLSRLSRIQPLLIFIDDLHWADAVSFDLYVTLTQAHDSPSILYLSSFRQESSFERKSVRSLLKKLTSMEITLVLDLFPLSESESTLLAKKLLEKTTSLQLETRQSIMQSLVHEANGIPFFICELTRYIESLAEQKLDITAESIRLDKVILERIQALPDESRTILSIIAVNNDPISHKVLSDAAEIEMSSEEWIQGIVSLRRGGLIRRRGLRGTDSVETYHDRIRETVLHTLDEQEIQIIHRKLALAMERLENPPYDLLARHWMGCDEKIKAHEYIRKAAQTAEEKFAFERAANLYRMALALEESEPEKLMLWKLRGTALANAGKPQLAAKSFQMAVEFADPATRLELQSRATEQLLRSGQISESYRVMGEVLGEIGLKFCETPQQAIMSYLFQNTVNYFRGIRFREKDPSEISRKDMARLKVLWYICLGLSLIDTIRMIPLLAKFWRYALKTGEIKQISGALILDASMKAALGGRYIQRARQTLLEAEALARKSDTKRLQGLALSARGMIEYFSGSWQAAIHEFLRAEELLTSHCPGATFELATARLFLCFSLLHHGDIPDLIRRFRRYLRYAYQIGDNFLITNLNTRLNICYLFHDKPESARRALDSALHTWPDNSVTVQHFYHLFAQCEYLLYQDEPLQAHELLKASVPVLRKALLLKIQIIRVEILQLEGRVLLALLSILDNENRKKKLRQRLKILYQKISQEDLIYATAWANYLKAGYIWQKKEISIVSFLPIVEHTIRQLEAADLKLYSQYMKRVQNTLHRDAISGEKDETEEWLRNQGITSLDAVARIYVPGFVFPHRELPDEGKS